MTVFRRLGRLQRVDTLRATAALLSIVGFGTVATLASWSDSGAQLTTFTAGGIDLKFDGTTSGIPSALAGLTLSNAAPGMSVAKPLTVNNTGSLSLLMAMTTETSSTDLASALQLTVLTDVATDCTTTNVSGGTTGGTALVPAQPLNATTGSFSNRTIAASGSAGLCFVVALPSSAGTTAMGKNTSATFTASPS